MLRFIKHKLLNKKWLNACLIIGIVLLVAVFSFQPMFRNGSLDKLLIKKFDDYIEENNEYPAIISRSGSLNRDDGEVNTKIVYDRMEAYQKKWSEYINIPITDSQMVVYANGGNCTPDMKKTNVYVSFGCIRDIDEHSVIVKGVSIEEARKNLDEITIPCLMPECVMDETGLVVGETLVIDYMTDIKGNPVRIYIAGVIKEELEKDNFYVKRLSEYERMVLFAPEDFDHIINDFDTQFVYYDLYTMWDYTKINNENAENFRFYIDEFKKNDKNIMCNFENILMEYSNDARTVNTILWVLELPIICLLLLFIYMVSSQILSMEAGEIAMLKSRGVKRSQIIVMYIEQSVILSLISLIPGIPLGYALCKAAASTDSFLQFSSKNISEYKFTPQMILYGLVVLVIAVIFMTLPVIGMSKLTITQQKSINAVNVKEKPFWEKYFIDVILLAISAYLLYNYNRQISLIALDVISGKSLDPVIFLDSSLFLFAVGLFMLRIINLITALIYRIGKKHWKPAIYASFLQITRSKKKQGFISVFLVMTIAMGLFDSNLARTINDNNIERISYNIGTDLVIDEIWKIKIFKPDKDTTLWSYPEPSMERYTDLSELGVTKMTRVIVDDRAVMKSGKFIDEECLFMAVNTKEFGETATLKDGLTDIHWFNYLNSLAEIPNGVIISRNYAEKCQLEIGDEVTYSRYSPIKVKGDALIADVKGKIVGIVDAFPGYERYYYKYNTEGQLVEKERYLVVANYSYAVSMFSLTPYKIWCKTDGSVPDIEDKVKDYAIDRGIKLKGVTSLEKDIADMRSLAIIQITNGMFTISFLISIIICAVGFLIYWILSIKKREMLFGIYRAMGMSMKEINKMLINEQIFSSVLAVIAGVGAGYISTILFTKILSIVYLPKKHNIDLQVFMNMDDTIKLLIVIFAVFIICFLVLRRILKGMNITQALKLGED